MREESIKYQTRHFNCCRPLFVRKGVATIESMIILTGLLFVLFSFLDTCLAVYHHNTLRVISKDLARFASIRGADFNIDQTEILGPETVNGSGAEIQNLLAIIARRQRLLDVTNITYQISWPDGDNQPGDTVLIELQYRYTPILPTSNFVLPETLQANSKSIIH
jgi:Flp pilus assembly protein TadG